MCYCVLRWHSIQKCRTPIISELLTKSYLKCYLNRLVSKTLGYYVIAIFFRNLLSLIPSAPKGPRPVRQPDNFKQAEQVLIQVHKSWKRLVLATKCHRWRLWDCQAPLCERGIADAFMPMSVPWFIWQTMTRRRALMDVSNLLYKPNEEEEL